MFIEVTPIDDEMENKIIKLGGQLSKENKDKTYFIDVKGQDILSVLREIFSIDSNDDVLKFQDLHLKEYYYNREINNFITKYE